MQRTKILVTTLGIVLAFGLLWASRSQADAIDHYQPAVLLKAERALDNGDATEALALLEGRVEALRHGSMRAAGDDLICRAHYERGDYAAAEAACDRAVASGAKTSTWSYLNNRGVMRLLQGKLEAAFEDFTEAAGLNPRARSVKRNLQVAERELKGS